MSDNKFWDDLLLLACEGSLACATCTGGADTCTTCASGDYLKEGTCVASCESGTTAFYQNEGDDTCDGKFSCNGQHQCYVSIKVN